MWVYRRARRRRGKAWQDADQIVHWHVHRAAILSAISTRQLHDLRFGRFQAMPKRSLKALMSLAQDGKTAYVTTRGGTIGDYEYSGAVIEIRL